MMELIYSDTKDLGTCFISLYRAPGDLYDSWTIESVDSGVVPDARYGPDAPDWNHVYGPYDLVEVIETFDSHGWTERFISLYADGTFIASRPI